MSETLVTRQLHMGGPRRTEVRRAVPALRDTWLRFAWLRDPPALDGEMVERLDAWWWATGLTGAVILQESPQADEGGIRVRECRTPELALNVLLRARGPLLLADMPLLDDPRVLTGTETYADDPRLLALEGIR